MRSRCVDRHYDRDETFTIAELRSVVPLEIGFAQTVAIFWSVGWKDTGGIRSARKFADKSIPYFNQRATVTRPAGAPRRVMTLAPATTVGIILRKSSVCDGGCVLPPA